MLFGDNGFLRLIETLAILGRSASTRATNRSVRICLG